VSLTLICRTQNNLTTFSNKNHCIITDWTLLYNITDTCDNSLTAKTSCSLNKTFLCFIPHQLYRLITWKNRLDWVRFNIPPNTLYVISGTGFYTSNNLTNSVKALKEDRFLKIRLQSNQVHPTALTIIQQLYSMKQKHTKYTQINTIESTHSEMGPVWQNPIQRTVRTAHLSVLMTVHSFSTQYNTEQFW